MKALPTPKDVRGWESQNNLVIEQNFRQLEESLRSGYQPHDATLTAFAALSGAADKLPYFTGADAFALADFTAAGRALLDDANAAAQRTTLGLGTAATQNTGTSGATVPLLNAANTFGAAQTVERGANGDVFMWRGAGSAKTGYLYSDGTYVGIFDAAITGGNGWLFGEATPKAYCFVAGAIAGTFSATGLNNTAIGATTPAAAAVTTLSITQGAVISGTYTPTITAVTNVTSSTASQLQYMRVGNVVTVSGELGLTPTGAGTMTARFTLPIASNLGTSTNLGGTAVAWNTGAPLVAAINADTVNDAAQIRVANSAGVGVTLHFSFQYLIA